jgi:uncharacterized membrane protein YfcA
MQIVFFMALVGLAAFCQNLTGFAFGLIFVGVAGATGLMNIADAANVACLLSIINGVSYMRAYRFEPDWAMLKPMLISSVLGVVGGVLLLHWLSGNTLNGLRMLLGLVIVLCAMLLLMQKKALDRPSALSPCGWPACPRGCSVVCLPRPARPWSITSTASRWIACWCATACLPCLSPAPCCALPWWRWRGS